MAKIIEFSLNYKKSEGKPENEKPKVIEMKPRRVVESSDDDLLYFEKNINKIIDALDPIFAQNPIRPKELASARKLWEDKSIRDLVDAALNTNPILRARFPAKYYALVKILEEKISYHYDLKKE